MFDTRARLAVTIVATALALSSCSSTGTKTETTGVQSGTPTATQTTVTQRVAPAQKASPGVDSKAAFGDVKLGAIRVDAKLGTPSANVTITNHSSKRSNYIVDLSITDGASKISVDAAMVSAPGLAPGQSVTRVAHFKTTQKLPTGASLKVVGIARLTA